jgi:hypothetical protein
MRQPREAARPPGVSPAENMPQDPAFDAALLDEFEEGVEVVYAIWEEENLYPPVLHSLHTSESEAVELAEKLDRENFPRYTIKKEYKRTK